MGIVSRGLRLGHVTSGARDQMGVSHYCLLTTDSQVARMSLDLYTRNIPPTQKARFWGNYVSALKGNSDLCAAPEARVTNFYPDLRNEFGKLESLMWNQTKTRANPTPCLPEANDRINTLGYNYCPVHTDIYGSYRNKAVRGSF